VAIPPIDLFNLRLGTLLFSNHLRGFIPGVNHLVDVQANAFVFDKITVKKGYEKETLFEL
jgi:hypothetical protein